MEDYRETPISRQEEKEKKLLRTGTCQWI